MSISMQNKVVLLTGGARGIGAAMAGTFAAAGARVMVADVLTDAGLATAEAIRKSGGEADFVEHDVRDEAAWESAIAATVLRFGTLTTVVNNAGIEASAPIAELSIETFDRLMSVNIRGLTLGMKHAMRAMRPGGIAGDGGAILNLSSMAHLRANPGTAAYAATKSAVDRLTKVGAVEGGKFGWNIRVNCLYPGLIQTEMLAGLLDQQIKMGFFQNADEMLAYAMDKTPLGRLGAVEDIANAALFLCSDLAGFVTGAGLSVDGGMALT
ncbi:SDR family NAD(P)-dependent oxidoreductase [Paraburkholderia nodosa]|uniref:SDR family NAD(P)-dependent oxidoreductase n=1 Tax=Paraburkholderia nodosa TaxID=392320 RepID=UPI000486D776|nr:SDR family NAD(P)-dependent oxidoreductase [Paraburkholderia nodosa]